MRWRIRNQTKRKNCTEANSKINSNCKQFICRVNCSVEEQFFPISKISEKKEMNVENSNSNLNSNLSSHSVS